MSFWESVAVWSFFGALALGLFVYAKRSLKNDEKLPPEERPKPPDPFTVIFFAVVSGVVMVYIRDPEFFWLGLSQFPIPEWFLAWWRE